MGRGRSSQADQSCTKVTAEIFQQNQFGGASSPELRERERVRDERKLRLAAPPPILPIFSGGRRKKGMKRKKKKKSWEKVNLIGRRMETPPPTETTNGAGGGAELVVVLVQIQLTASSAPSVKQLRTEKEPVCRDHYTQKRRISEAVSVRPSCCCCCWTTTAKQFWIKNSSSSRTRQFICRHCQCHHWTLSSDYQYSTQRGIQSAECVHCAQRAERAVMSCRCSSQFC